MKRWTTLLIFILAEVSSFPAYAVDAILHSFSNADGSPAIYGSLTSAGSVLYGMTSSGGSESAGSIFQMNADGSGFAVIHNFTNDGLHSDGNSPLSSLTVSGSVLYGMTPFGGIVPPSGPPGNGGTVFRINTDGSGFQVLHGFTGSQLAGSSDGGSPYGAVTVSGTTLYGMTRFGGSNAVGTIFSMQSDGSGFQILHNFAGGTNDGAQPQGSLTLVGSQLYGLTNAGGTNGEGTVFCINTDGTGFQILHSFDVFGSGLGAEPIGGNGLTLVGTTLYGVTYYDGAAQNGCIFSINPDGSNFQIVHSFAGSDGAGPYGSLILAGSQLYGSTSGFSGADNNASSTVFGMSLDGSAFTVIQTFAGGPSDGFLALGSLVLSADGTTLYGTTQYGGSNDNGTIFSAPASGSLTNANLFSLVPSAGMVTSAFNSFTTRYTVYVSDTTTSFSLTPTPSAPGASLTINGVSATPGVPSAPINLSTGSNVVDTLVTAPDGVTTNLYTLNVVRLTNLQTWRLNFFGTSANAGYAANSADYDGNGIPNLVKYAFGLNPTVTASNQIPQAFFGAGVMGFMFTEPAGISGILYGAEWTQIMPNSAWTPLTDTGSGATHQFQATTSGLPSAFMRLRVTVPLSPIEQLGKNIFFDNTLSNPSGMSCASCHSPSAGFTGPNSNINLTYGPVPGAVSGRFGFRKPQAVAYSTFSPSGPYFDNNQQLWSGGNFWDGHAPTNVAQALMPLIGPNEMANTPVGAYPPHPGGYSPDVVQKISQASYAALFSQVFGAGVFQSGNEATAYADATQAIAAYEASEEVNPFSSKFDASANATPPSNAYQFTASEQNGMNLFFGKAQCFQCHSSTALDSVSSVTNGREVFTMYCYANIGVPKNPANPYYQQTDSVGNPYGYNPLGTAFIDYGLGANPNPAPDGTRFMTTTAGDVAAFRGVFKAPSLRNVDLRPTPDFVKSYMHNGVFKNLADVVHFYNKRNIAVDSSGNEAAFDLRDGPPSGFTPIFAPPEALDNVQNVSGLTPDESRQGEADVATNGQIGHLELTASEEADLVNFLMTLTDGFTGSVPQPP